MGHYLNIKFFLMQGLHRIYLCIALDLPNESNLLLDSPALQDYDNWLDTN